MILKYLVLYIPFLLAVLFSDIPDISYMIAWLGSFFIFFISFSGFIKPIPEDRSLFEQAMRPLVLTQIIFAGYMAITSIFYFLNANGYYFLTKDEFAIVDGSQISLIAECQRYYNLGHAAFVTGLLTNMNYNKGQYYFEVKNISTFTLKLNIVFTFIAFLVNFVPGLAQFRIMFQGLAMVSSVISLSYAIPEGKFIPTLVAGFLFISNELNALTSGWKEQVLVPIIMLGTYLYPSYKKTVTVSVPFILFFYFYFIPTYNGIVRNLSWGVGEMDGASAAKLAIEQIQSGEEDLVENNWGFLTGRLSEIGMFVKYVNEVPKNVDYYGLQIVWQALESIIPRVLYENKPITETLVMERVIKIGVISELSTVSAKTPPVTDGYISGGGIGVFLTCLFLGLFASWASVKAEYLFGGYLIGSGLMYTGLFQILWRGNCFEFMSNNLFWAVVALYILHYIGKRLNIIKEIKGSSV